METIYDSHGEALDILGQDFLAFGLAGHAYGVDYAAVEEIRRFEAGMITGIQGAPAFVRGAGYIAGRHVPVLDLASRLGQPPVDAQPQARIVFLTLHGQLLGLLVDQVAGVTIQQADDISPPPAADPIMPVAAIQGVGTHHNQPLVLVSLEQLIPSDEAAQLCASATKAKPA